MPRRVWPLWLRTLALPVFFPVLNFIYWRQVYFDGQLPVDGNSIAIGIFNSLLFSAFGLSPFLLSAWFCLRRYNPEARLLTLRWDRPVRTIAAALVFGGLAALLISHDISTPVSVSDD